MKVLVAIQDAELRQAVTALLEDDDCQVVAVERGLTAFTALARSARPVIVLLDVALGDRAAAEQLLGLAQAGRPWVCHDYLLLSTVARRHWSPRLTRLVEAEQLPVLQLPSDLDGLLPLVRQALAAHHGECGCLALSA